LEAARQAAAFQPDNLHVLTTLGAALYRHADYAEADTMLRRAADAYRKANMAISKEILALQIMCHIRLGRVGSAREVVPELKHQLRASAGTLNGTLGGQHISKFSFHYYDKKQGNGVAHGEGWFELSPDATSFDGRWRPAGQESWDEWRGVRRSRGSADFAGLWSTTGGAMWLSTGDGSKIEGFYGIDSLTAEAILTLDGPRAAIASELEQWASTVICFSSQFSSPEWSAMQVLGPPDTFEYGDHKTAWAPAIQDAGAEYIAVAFEQPVYATAVTVRETNSNGFVTQIDAIDEADVLHTVWKGDDICRKGTPVEFYTAFPQTTYRVKGVKIYVKSDRSDNDWEEIDAVKLHGVLFPAPQPTTAPASPAASQAVSPVPNQPRDNSSRSERPL
jgi:hypothetical protein